MKKNLGLSLLAVCVLAILYLLLVPKDNSKPGRDYMPDMRYSKAYETYQSYDFYYQRGFDTMTARLPEEGTIPKGYIPDDSAVRGNEAFLRSFLLKNELHTRNQDSAYLKLYAEAGAVLKNPFALSPEILSEGKELYTVYCQVCHGEKGEGNGQIVELPGGGDGPYGARPPAYATRLPQLTDGNIFFTIAYGKGNMGGYGPMLTPSERWKVVYYIKELAGINGAPAAPVADTTNATSKTVAMNGGSN